MSRPARDVSRVAAVLAVLTACAVGAACAARSDAPRSTAAVGLTRGQVADDADIQQLLSRAAFGAGPGDVERVRASGLAAWIDTQLHPERVDDGPLEARLQALKTLTLGPHDLAEEYFKPADAERRRRQQAGEAAPTAAAEPEVIRRPRVVGVELAGQKLLRAVYSERQLQEVLVDFWFNHFNVFFGKGADRLYIAEYERRAIRPHVFGRFRNLLGAVAESPAMLFYLDNWMSTDPNGPHPVPVVGRPGRGRAPRLPARAPRPARRGAGLNENYARELMELHTLGVNGGYTQHDVTEVARCFTGWTIAAPNDGGAFVFDARRHDEGPKLVLGQRIKPGGGKDDGEKVLDILARHPSTARFIATKLVRRLVADDPPADLVARVADRFRATDGDLREVVRVILASREFYRPAYRGAKLKTPLEFVASALRAVNAQVGDASAAVNALRALGMPPYGALAPNGYPDQAAAWDTAGTLLARMNFATAVVNNRLRGITVDLPALAGASDPALLRSALPAKILGDRLSPSTRDLAARQARPADVAALVLASPEFQRR